MDLHALLNKMTLKEKCYQLQQVNSNLFMADKNTSVLLIFGYLCAIIADWLIIGRFLKKATQKLSYANIKNKKIRRTFVRRIILLITN